MATPERPWSLSPAALRAAPFTERLVLPSPNGSAIAAAAQGLPVVAASLRNAAAVARWLAGQRYGTTGRPVAVIAAGERWPDGGLRPALEDLLGAGAVMAGLCGRTGQDCDPSPEARLAAQAYEATPDPRTALTACASGRELAGGGFAADVAVAAELDASEAVPVLADGAFSDRAAQA
jgi:2-phosphosulfolactate phosphatase